MNNNLGIPKDILAEFLKFVNTDTTTTKRYFDIDPDSGIKVLKRVVEESRPRDLKSAINFYEKMYPQYFDPLTREKLLALQQATGTSDGDQFADEVRNMFEVKNDN